MFLLQPNCSGICDILAAPPNLLPMCFSWEPPSQPEVTRWLTFLSVAQGLSLSSNVQTQVSGLQSNTETDKDEQGGSSFPLVMQAFIYILK